MVLEPSVHALGLMWELYSPTQICAPLNIYLTTSCQAQRSLSFDE